MNRRGLPYLSLAGLFLAASLLLAAGAPPAVGAPAEAHDTAAIRQLVTLPLGIVDHRMGLTLGLGYIPGVGFAFHSSAADPEALRRARAKADHKRNDAQAWYRLGQLLRADKRPQEAAAAFTRAATLARTAAERRPQDPRAAEWLARAQWAAGEPAAAAATLRAAVERWPERRSARIALGNTLAAVGTMESLREAEQVFDAAVAAAPRHPEVYAARANFRFGRERETEALSDYRRAGELGRNDPYALALSPWMEGAVSARHTGGQLALDTSWTTLSPAVREAVSRTMDRLLRLGQSSDPSLAGKALTALGFLRYELQHDTSRSLSDLRAALRRDPDRQDAREMILHIYGVESRWEELAAYGDACARRSGRVRFRLVAAFALARLGRFAEAASRLDAALRDEPDDLALLLARAAVALKHPGGPDGDAFAGTLLERADRVSAAQPEFRPELAYLRGLHLALTGHPATARMALTEALASPAGRQAREALKLLNAR